MRRMQRRLPGPCLLAFGWTLCGPGLAWAQASGPVRVLTAVRASSPPVIDGRLDDRVWSEAPPLSGFLQRDPDEGMPATDDTFVRIAYDDEALYVGARMLDASRAPSCASSRAATSRWTPTPSWSTSIPTTTSSPARSSPCPAAGVQRDASIYNDSFLDSSWDAVWESAVTIETDGWTVEMRIPLSQLRFPKAARYTWGSTCSGSCSGAANPTGCS